MGLNPVVSMLGRRLRLAVIGGGPGSFIGELHRLAARFDDRYELVSGVVSSDPQRAVEAGEESDPPVGRLLPGAQQHGARHEAPVEVGPGADEVHEHRLEQAADFRFRFGRLPPLGLPPVREGPPGEIEDEEPADEVHRALE